MSGAEGSARTQRDAGVRPLLDFGAHADDRLIRYRRLEELQGLMGRRRPRGDVQDHAPDQVHDHHEDDDWAEDRAGRVARRGTGRVASWGLAMAGA